MKTETTNRRNHTTAFIVDGRDYFAAHLDNGGARVGLVGGVAFDFPASHDTYAWIISLATEDEAETLFDVCCGTYL